MRRPIERPEECPCRDGGIGRAKLPAPDAVGDQRADAVLVPVALRDNRRSKTRRERVHFQVRRRSVHFVDEAEDVRNRKIVEATGERGTAAARGRQRGEQPVQRAILAEEENLVLAAEIVIQVARREVGGDGDVAHAGRGKPARAEHVGGGFQDADAAGIGAQ